MNLFIKISSFMEVYSIHYLKEFKRLHAELLNITKSLILLILNLAPGLGLQPEGPGALRSGERNPLHS
jgi:hypothetical protein